MVTEHMRRREALFSLTGALEKRSWSHNHRESGECRLMPVREKLVRFACKPLPEKRDALKATLRGILGTDADAAERRLEALRTGPHAPPAVL